MMGDNLNASLVSEMLCEWNRTGENSYLYFCPSSNIGETKEASCSTGSGEKDI